MRFSEYENMKKAEANEIKNIRISLKPYGVSDNDGLVNYVHAIVKERNKMRRELIKINKLTKVYRI
jgi:hypothetical protein